MSADEALLNLIRENSEAIDSIQHPDLDALIERIGSSRVVLLGESTHGTEEFYDLRAAITMKLIKEKGFNVLGFEADWPDMEGVNDFVHGRRPEWSGFARFPQWMWRNHSFDEFTRQLKSHNMSERNLPVSVFGLDIYSLSASLDNVYRFLAFSPGKIRRRPTSHEKQRAVCSLGNLIRANMASPFYESISKAAKKKCSTF